MLVARDRLEHALHDAALADRAGAVRASVMPGVEFIPDPKDADFLVPAHDDLAIAIGVIVDVASHVLGHAPPPISFCRKRAELPVAGPATADQHRYLACHHRRRLVEPPILNLDGAIAGVYREQAMPHDTPSPTHCMLRQRNNDRSRTVIRSHEDRPF